VREKNEGCRSEVRAAAATKVQRLEILASHRATHRLVRVMPRYGRLGNLV
jgi:hypothetical protein